MVKHAGRAPGGGPRRRIRTTVESVGASMKIVRRNRSIKPIPVNWRIQFKKYLRGLHDNVPPQLRSRYKINQATVPAPEITIPAGSRSDSGLIVVLSRFPELRRQQAALLEFALRTSDVLTWPVPTARISRGPGRTTRVATNLPTITDSPFVGTIRHSFDPMHLADVGINPAHIVEYDIRRGKAHYIGIRTSCDRSTCGCGAKLEGSWSRAWVMTY